MNSKMELQKDKFKGCYENTVMSKKLNFIILFIGVIAPILIRLLFPTTYHHSDMDIISSWSNYSVLLKEIYTTDCYCNYPFIGLFFSTGLLKLFGNSIFLYLIFLAFIDSINVLLLYLIFKKTAIRNAASSAGIIGLLPSSWVGGGLWGQIDNIGLLIILVLILFLLTLDLKRAKVTSRYFAVKIGIIGIVIGVGLLTKQLLVFTLFPISIFISIFIFALYRNNLKQLGPLLLFFMISIFLPIIIIDYWLILPESIHISHLERVVLKGSSHMNKISGNGFNMWMLSNLDMWSSSKIPFLYSLTPMIAGILIFLINSLVLVIIFILKNIFVSVDSNKTIISDFLLLIALFNLSFNLFLTGTHERYLYYFYPIIFVYFLITNDNDMLRFKSNKLEFGLSIIGSILYGSFVLLVLTEHRYHQSYIMLFIYHFILYGVLAKIFFKGFKYQKSIEKLRSHLK